MPSMQLAVEDPGANSSNCGEGYSCAYTNTISWSSPTTPLPMELNPQVVFERMFGDGSTVEQRAARRRAGSQHSRLAHRLAVPASQRVQRAPIASASTSTRENVREIERRLQIAMKASTVAPEDLTVPVGVPQTFDEHIKLQFDLLALAFQADITRVGTMLFARDLTGRTYPASEAPTLGFHGGSHHGEDPRRIDDLSKINQYHVKMLAHFVDKLAKTQDGDGTLLDHSLVLYGTNMGNSNQHLHDDVPHVLVGGLNGKLKGGRHLAYPTKTVPTGNLLLSVLDKFGIPAGKFGDSTGQAGDVVKTTDTKVTKVSKGTKAFEFSIFVAFAIFVCFVFAVCDASRRRERRGRRRHARRHGGRAHAAGAERRRERRPGRRRDGAALGGLPRTTVRWSDAADSARARM